LVGNLVLGGGTGEGGRELGIGGANLEEISYSAGKACFVLLLVVDSGFEPSDQLRDGIAVATDKFLVVTAALVGSPAFAEFLREAAEDAFLSAGGFVGEVGDVFLEEGNVGEVLSAVPVALAEAVPVDRQLQLLHGVVFWLVIVILLALLISLHFPLSPHLPLLLRLLTFC
jgi:hypothetical protein